MFCGCRRSVPSKMETKRTTRKRRAKPKVVAENIPPAVITATVIGLDSPQPPLAKRKKLINAKAYRTMQRTILTLAKRVKKLQEITQPNTSVTNGKAQSTASPVNAGLTSEANGSVANNLTKDQESLPKRDKPSSSSELSPGSVLPAKVIYNLRRESKKKKRTNRTMRQFRTMERKIKTLTGKVHKLQEEIQTRYN